MTDEILHAPLGDNPPSARLIYGVDAITGLNLLADQSVHTIATGPPYLALRDYLPNGHPLTPSEIGRKSNGVPKDIYLQSLVAVFHEARRVLRDDGLAFVNIADTFDSTTGSWHCVPADFANAMKADGWILRSDVIWHKQDPMPCSHDDRFTPAHEHIYVFSKKRDYYFDVHADRESTDSKEPGLSPQGRQRTDVWTLAKESATGRMGDEVDHHAPYPTALAKRCILTATSAKGVCPACGGPYTRDVERIPLQGEGALHAHPRCAADVRKAGATSGLRTNGRTYTIVKTTGWSSSCNCTPQGVPGRATVLDPFCGSGTTGGAALLTGRHFVGIEINEKFLPLARVRVLGGKPQAAQDPRTHLNGAPSVLDIF